MRGKNSQPIRARRLFLTDADEAAKEMARIGADPAGIEIMSAKAEHYLIRLENLSSRAANIIKQESLARGAELAVSRKAAIFEPGRSDALLMGTRSALSGLAEKLRRQGHFGLPEAAALIERILADRRLVPGKGESVAGPGFTLDLAGQTYLLQAGSGQGEADVLIGDPNRSVMNIADAAGAMKAAISAAGIIRLDPGLEPGVLASCLEPLAGGESLLIIGPGVAAGDQFPALWASLETVSALGINLRRVILQCSCPTGPMGDAARSFIRSLAAFRSLGRPVLVDLGGADPAGADPAGMRPPPEEAALIAWVTVLSARGADLIRLSAPPDMIKAIRAALRAADAVLKSRADAARK